MLKAVLLNDQGAVVRRSAIGSFYLPIKGGALQGYFIEVNNDSIQTSAILISPNGEVVGLMPDFVLLSV